MTTNKKGFSVMRLSLLGMLALLLAGAASAQHAKRLIEWGWDEPDTAFVRAHLAELERTPFDGCVFTARYQPGSTGTAGTLAWEGWGSKAFVGRELAGAKADLAALPFSRFTDNFLRINVTPGTVDWFGDFAPLLNNMRLAARLTRSNPAVKGICFDLETYGTPIWDYASQANAATKTLDEYSAQVKQRGREVMRAFHKGRPAGLTLFLPVGYAQVWADSRAGTLAPKDQARNLLGPFLDGMLAAAQPGVVWFEGYEQAYSWRSPELFTSAATDARTGLPYAPADPAKFRRLLRVGFGLWLDYRSGSDTPWSLTDPDTNYFPPALFETTVRQALTVADTYAWVYTEKPRWWTATGGAVNLPAPYVDALWRARAGLCPPPGVTFHPPVRAK